MWTGPHGAATAAMANVLAGIRGQCPPCYTPREYDYTAALCRHARDRGHPPSRGHDLRELRQPHRTLPEEDARRFGRRREPGDGGGDDPLPAGGRGSGGAGSRDRSRGVLAQAGTGRRIGGDADTPRGLRRRRRRAGGSRPADPPRGRRLDRCRPRDHGRDVLAPDGRSRWRTSTGSSSCRRRSSSSGQGGGSTRRPGERLGTAGRRWTRSSRSGRRRPGATASS